MLEQDGPKKSISSALLRAAKPDESGYEAYRMKLESALNRAERVERITFHIGWVSFLTSVTLSLVGGTQIAGSFDPYDANANPLSITLATIYVLASIAWPLSLASLYSRFRPRIRSVKQEINDARNEQLQREVKELREQLRNRHEGSS